MYQQNLGSLPKSRFINGLVFPILMKTADEVYMSKTIPAKYCAEHGTLSIKDIFSRKRNGKVYFECNICKKKSLKKYYAESKEKNFDYSKKVVCKHHGELKKEDIYVVGSRYKCKYCNAIRCRKWENKNRSHVNARRRKWYKANIKEEREKRILQKYGLSATEYYLMYEEQGHSCAICKKSGKPSSLSDKPFSALAVDHCHKTGVIRKLLCFNCNTMLGQAKDNIDILRKAVKYLEEHQDVV